MTSFMASQVVIGGSPLVCRRSITCSHQMMSTSTKNPSEGVVVSSVKRKLKQHEYKGTQQDLHQILHTCTLSRRVGGVIAASQL